MSQDLLAGIHDRGQDVACGEGWWPIINLVDKALAAIDPDYELEQIKQKFGTLRYHAHTDVREPTLRQAFRKLIEGAEDISAQTCEGCGRRGELYQTPGADIWLETLCAECATGTSQPGRNLIPTNQQD